jgi:hypothetical protein
MHELKIRKPILKSGNISLGYIKNNKTAQDEKDRKKLKLPQTQQLRHTERSVGIGNTVSLVR